MSEYSSRNVFVLPVPYEPRMRRTTDILRYENEIQESKLSPRWYEKVSNNDGWELEWDDPSISSIENFSDSSEEHIDTEEMFSRSNTSSSCTVYDILDHSNDDGDDEDDNSTEFDESGSGNFEKEVLEEIFSRATSLWGEDEEDEDEDEDSTLYDDEVENCSVSKSFIEVFNPASNCNCSAGISRRTSLCAAERAHANPPIYKYSKNFNPPRPTNSGHPPLTPLNFSNCDCEEIQQQIHEECFSFFIPNKVSVQDTFYNRAVDKRIFVVENFCNCRIEPIDTPAELSQLGQLMYVCFNEGGHPTACRRMLEELAKRISKHYKRFFLIPMDLRYTGMEQIRYLKDAIPHSDSGSKTPPTVPQTVAEQPKP